MISAEVKPYDIQNAPAAAMPQAMFGLQPLALEKLALIIPTLCEAENIGGLLDHVRSVLDPLHIPYEILVVDDDSSDATGAVVSAIALQENEACPAPSSTAGRIPTLRFWA